MNNNNFADLEKIVGYEFKNKELIKRAVTHSSASSTFNYERMEFLGDSLLSMIVAEHLYKNTNYKVGSMSVIRSNLVSTEALSKLVLKHDLKKFIVVGGSVAGTKNVATNVLADFFESLTAGIYLDGGFEVTKNFVEKFVLSDVEHFVNADYKTLLQEKLATIDKKSKLEYGLIGSSGPSHQLTFEMGIYFNDELILTAKGKSKKEAEQLCAKLFLEKLEKTT